MTLIDTHCHLDFPEFDPDRDEVLTRAKEAGVTRIINVGSSIKGSAATVALASRYENVYGVVGVHPHDADKESKIAYPSIKPMLAEKRIVAVGEIGLDYYKNFSGPENQRELFRSLLGLAKESGLPVVLHSRQAEEDTLGIAREFLPFPAVVHCFSGDQRFLNACLELGWHISFTSNITYKKAEGLRAVVKAAPLERIMVETDCPYLSPEGKRGKRNEPTAVVEVCQEIARIKDLPFDEVCRVTTLNAERFFRLP